MTLSDPLSRKDHVLFNSISFLLFFSIVAIVYFSIPDRFRWIWLLCVSYYFYISWKPIYIILIILTTLTTYFACVQMGKTESMSRRKTFLVLALVFNIGLLFLFKYYNFFNDSLKTVFGRFYLFYPIYTFHFLLPVGISFYIFKGLSYTIDVYRGDIKPERHLGLLALYISFFPQILAGPIERATKLLPQLYRKFDFHDRMVTDGLRLMLWGFFKKMVIADNLALLVDSVYNQPTEYQGGSLVLATLFYTFQIYCDFSGYSDIAIGAAQVMGFNTMENFNRPYFSQSVPEFWRKWHISLSTWFRDYLYIPLGGNRVSSPRRYLNLFIVLLTCGLWHGANWTFVVWGGVHGMYLILSFATEKARKKIYQMTKVGQCPKLHRSLKVAITFLLVSFAWIFFRANSVSDAFYIITHMGIGWDGGALQNIPFWGSLKFEFIVGISSIGVLILVEKIQSDRAFTEMISLKPVWVRWSVYYSLLFSVLILGHFGQRQFIYFQF